MMAVMGPSGCGKTTLLSLLAKRKLNNLGRTLQTGEINVNGASYTSMDYCHFGAYV